MVMQRTARQNRQEAVFYQKEGKDGAVVCLLCPRQCRLMPGQIGFCGARGNQGGRLYALSYGWVRVLHLELIDALPFTEFYEGMGALAVGTYGCNMRCPICNTWQITNGPGTGKYIEPEELVELACRLLSKDNVGIAYSYNEPLVGYEFVRDGAMLAKALDLRVMISTNGIINAEPLRRLLPFLDAVNLDIKTMDAAYYDNVLQAPLQIVLENAKTIYQSGVHLEISTVLQKGVNDQPEQLQALAAFIADELGPEVPIHILEQLPNGKMLMEPTTETELMTAAKIVNGYLLNVYIGTP